MVVNTKKKKKRILFVAIPDSIHTLRWISQIFDQEWEIYIFPSTSGRLNSDFRDITAYVWSTRIYTRVGKNVVIKYMLSLKRIGRSINKVLSKIFPDLSDEAKILNKIIKEIQPDLIHSLEIQHAGYLVLDAKKKFNGKFPPWAVTNWGSDIYLFGRIPEHIDKIKNVLTECDYYDCECQRDVVLAKSFGFAGKVFPVLPNTGGFDFEKISGLREPGLTSARRVIVMKGYQHWAGRALVGLRAIELCADILKEYKICIYLSSSDVTLAAELLRFSSGLNIEIIPQTSHDEILKLHGKARISIGLSISDSVSTSFLEAITMGSFPIQSNTSCAGEWINDGETGILVHPEDPQAIADAIRKTIGDDNLVDNAAIVNRQVVEERLDATKIKPQVIKIYNEILND